MTFPSSARLVELVDALGDAHLRVDHEFVVVERVGPLLGEELPVGATIRALVGEAIARDLAALAPDEQLSAAVTVGDLRFEIHASRAGSTFSVWLRDRTEHEALAREASAERHLRRRSEAFYEALVGCIDDAVLVHDFDTGIILEANPAALRMLGYSRTELRTLRGRDLHPPREHEGISDLSRRLRKKEAAGAPRIEVRRKDGETFWGAVRLNVFEHDGRRFIVSLMRDVSGAVEEADTLAQSLVDLEAAHAQLAQAQKLAAVGEVAAGVAHEINNPTAVMEMNQTYLDEAIGTVRALVADLEARAVDDPKVRALLDAHLVDLDGVQSVLRDNMEGTRRIASVCRNLRLFSRSDSSGPDESVDLEEVVHSTINLLRNEVRHRARLTVELAPTPPVRGDRFRIAQVVTNLLLNAIQATAEGATEENSIEVRTRQEGDAVVLEVHDTGEGMSAATKARIFEPFFTTRLGEQGTGLGLALCDDIVRQAGGHIDVASRLGEGTTFIVSLPVAASSESEERLRSSSAPPPSGTDRMRARILVVDDDASVVRAYRRLLRGFDAEVVASGFEAFEVLTTRSDFDLIICDLMMPEMDGPHFFQILSKRYPQLRDRVVFCTGGAFTPGVRQFAAETKAPVLDKPLTRRQVEELLAGIVSAPAAAPPQRRRRRTSVTIPAPTMRTPTNQPASGEDD